MDGGSALVRILNDAIDLADFLRRAVEGGLVSSEDAVAVSAAIDRIGRSVVRPLAAARDQLSDQKASLEPRVAQFPIENETAVVDALRGDRLWWLAKSATQLRMIPGLPLGVQEACAALQDLECVWAATDVLDARRDELWAIQELLEPSIQSLGNGPYLVTNVRDFESWLGVPIPGRPQMALCRCGKSALKPFCDGSHVAAGFTDAKDPNRVPDRGDSYPGLQATVLDNRGICQHSGYCTDRLRSVFRLGEDPFVTPSGGRLDEIIQSIRDCPSGALGLALDGHEEREIIDWHGTRIPSVTVSKDGPYRIVGRITLLDGNGALETRAAGASLEHYALCRCGHSQNKPFCSGMHWHVDFRDPVPDPDREPTLFEWCGGLPALIRMTRIFYGKYVAQDPLLAPLFSQMRPDHPERVARWLAEVFGGPKLYSTIHGGYPRMISQHIGRGLTEEQRGRWAALLTRSADDAGLPADPEFRSVFSSYIEWGSRLAVENSQVGAVPPPHMPMPSWSWQTAAGPPGSRMPAMRSGADDSQPTPARPDDGESISFAKHVKGLFRAVDRRSMLFAFDLWLVGDVRQHAEAILGRLRAGTMPCDATWPAADVELFERWVADGSRD